MSALGRKFNKPSIRHMRAVHQVFKKSLFGQNDYEPSAFGSHPSVEMSRVSLDYPTVSLYEQERLARSTSDQSSGERIMVSCPKTADWSL